MNANNLNEVLPFGEPERNEALKRFSNGEIKPLTNEDKQRDREMLSKYKKLD